MSKSVSNLAILERRTDLTKLGAFFHCAGRCLAAKKFGRWQSFTQDLPATIRSRSKVRWGEAWQRPATRSRSKIRARVVLARDVCMDCREMARDHLSNWCKRPGTTPDQRLRCTPTAWIWSTLANPDCCHRGIPACWLTAPVLLRKDKMLIPLQVFAMEIW